MMTRTSGQAACASELRGWLTGRLAVYLARPQSSIDPDTPLAEYGMDSVWALSLCGDLEEEKNLIVAPTLVWDHPTVSDIVAHLVRCAAAGAGLHAPSPPAQPALPTQPAQLQQPNQPARSEQPTPPAPPAQLQQSNQPARSEQLAQAARSEQPTQPARPEQLAQPARPEQAAQPSGAAPPPAAHPGAQRAH
ncbi:acyl carrier protein [Streptomyces sp. NPDC093510]|uniref:acyl carrier protein n=1 Tax=Streptomyces sp. NPDC093510 TaxID=3155199 RepID=UPI0034277078